MKIRLLLSLLGAGLMTGCATTQSFLPMGNDTPLAQILKLKPELRNELSTVEIRQYFNRVENPTAGEVKVTETNLMDDSVKSIRTTYSFKLNDNKWTLLAQKQEFQCLRGKNKNKFQTAKCP